MRYSVRASLDKFPASHPAADVDVASAPRGGRRVQGSGFRIWCVPLLCQQWSERDWHLARTLLKSSGTPSVPSADRGGSAALLGRLVIGKRRLKVIEWPVGNFEIVQAVVCLPRHGGHASIRAPRAKKRVVKNRQ